jgi:ankyrin repeat protein
VNFSGSSLLSTAATHGHKDIVELLLKRDDVDPNSKDNFGRTPLQMAAMFGHNAIVKLLKGRRPNS